MMLITAGLDSKIGPLIDDTGSLDGNAVRAIFGVSVAHIESNLKFAVRFHQKGPSNENWRWPSYNPEYTPGHRSEIDLERRILKVGRPHWGNQIPTQSGLTNSRAGKHSNIDLVRRYTWKHFSPKELKTVSNTPTEAAWQIIRYASIFVVSVRHYPAASHHRWPMLLAERLSLRVLAPLDYYRKHGGVPIALERAIDEGLSDLSDMVDRPLAMDFAFESLPRGIDYRSSDEELRAALDNIAPARELI